MFIYFFVLKLLKVIKIHEWPVNICEFELFGLSFLRIEPNTLFYPQPIIHFNAQKMFNLLWAQRCVIIVSGKATGGVDASVFNGNY